MPAAARLDPARYEGVHYFGGSRGHVESYFLKITDPTATRALWVKATIFAPKGKGEVLAESWAIAFDRDKGNIGIKTTVPFGHAHFSKERLDVALPDLTMTRERVKGDLRRGDDHHGDRISFDLELVDPSQPLLLYPTRGFYEGPFPASKVMTPLPDLRATGEVTVRGEKWDVRGWRGSLGHNWQRRHAFLYAWAHCNQWNEDGDVVFEGSSGRVQVGPVTLPTLGVLLLRYHGVRYELNRLVDIPRIRFSTTFNHWEFSGAGPMVSMRGEVSATKEDMVGLHYANPDGSMNYCLNSKLASARLEVAVRGRAPVVLTSRAAALEIGTRDPNHGVTMVL